MQRNNNSSLSYVKCRANKNLSIQNSGSSSSGSNYKENPSFNQNKSVSVSSRSSQDNNNKNKYTQNNQFSTIQEDNFNHLSRNIDFSQINLKSQMNQNRIIHNQSVYSQENKENVNINYSNYITNHHQLGQQQETFRKINQCRDRDEKNTANQQNQSLQKNSIQQQSARQKSNNSQPKNIYQQIMSNNISQVSKKNKGINSVISQQRQSLDLSNKQEIVEVQKKRSESTYSNYSFDSANNQSMGVLSSTNFMNNSNNSNSIQLNNWLQNNQLISLDNMRQAPPDSNCINISHLLNQNISQSNISVIDSATNLSSISPVGVAQNRPQSKSPNPFNYNTQQQNNTQNLINESQNQLISRQFNSVQNSKNNNHLQIQQLNQKQSSSINHNFTKQNSNQKISQKIQIGPDSSHQLHTFTSSENNNNGEFPSNNNNFNISQDRFHSQSNPSASNTLENLTHIQKQNELNQLKKDLRQSNNELIQFKNKVKQVELENKHLKQQIDQDKQQKLHLEEYIQKIKGLQFIIAQEKRISAKIVQENFQRNENVSLILSNLANIIKIIQQKIESPKVSCEKILQQISDNMNPILLCLNPIILDINSYNESIVKQLQNQHESRIEPNLQLNKQLSQKGKKLTLKSAQDQQQVVQRNNSNNKLINNQQLKKRGISVEEPSNPYKQKKQIANQNQSANSLARSHSSVNVNQQHQQQQKAFNGLIDDQFEQFNQGSQHLLKQSLSSINLQTQSLTIPQLDEQNENEIEAIISKQLLNNKNNPLQQIQIKQQEQKKPIKQQANKTKNSSNNQHLSLNECQRINTKESVDSFYQQCLLNNSLRISESSRSIKVNHDNHQYNTLDQNNPNFTQNSQMIHNIQNLQMNNNQQNDKDILSDNYPLQTGSIFGQLTQCSSSLGGVNNKLPSARGQFFDSQFSSLENYNSNRQNRNSNSNDSNTKHIIPPTSQEFTGCFSTQQNQNYLVGTFSQIPLEGGVKANIDSNYNSGQTDQDIAKGRRNSNGNNVFKMSNYNSGSSQYNQSQKLFSDTLKGLGETLKNLQQDDNLKFSEQNNYKYENLVKSKSTFRSNEEVSEQQQSQYQQTQNQKQERDSDDILNVNDKINKIGTEKSSTQLEIENLKMKIMQRQSRRKLQSCHNTSVQEISNYENSQRDMSAPHKDTLVNI